MNSALAGILTGVQGGANEYSDIKQEQRTYELDEKEADQAQMRRDNFAKYNYMNYTKSGMVDKDTGRRLSPGELEGLGDEGLSALESQSDREVRIKEETRVATEGRATTKAEAAKEEARKQAVVVRDEKREYDKGIAATKAKAAEKKLTKTEASKLKTKFTSSLNTALRDTDTRTEKTSAILNHVHDVYGDEPTIKNLPQVKKARFIENQAMKVAEMQAEGTSKTDILAAMKEEGMTPEDAREAYDYAKETGWFTQNPFGTNWVFGDKGAGQ